MRTVALLIKGGVQGVFYRVSAKETADELGVKGWVKNTENGDVEVIASGTNDAIQAFIAWCWKGPAKAKVETVIVTEKELEVFDSFQIKR